GGADVNVHGADGQLRDCAVGTVGDQRQIALRADSQPGGLPSPGNGAGDLGRISLQVDKEYLVVRIQPVRPSLRYRLERIGDESDITRRADGEVGRRSGDRIYQRYRGSDLRHIRLGNVDHRQRVMPGLAGNWFAAFVPAG